MAVAERIEPVVIEEEIQSSFIDYAMSVIVSRALPDVRDGLKPVHRRILFSMMEGNLTPDRPRRKSASAVGDVIKKYHPHGDQAVYDALVRMAQDFSLRYPLIDPQGNFGSVDGDPPGAMRYTEARLAPLAMELLRDIDKETVDFQPNFDGYEQEPVVLRARVEIEESSQGRMRLVVTELPYMVNKARLSEKIAQLTQTRKITDISDLRDESSGRGGMRLVIELKRNANPHVVLNQLHKHT